MAFFLLWPTQKGNGWKQQNKIISIPLSFSHELSFAPLSLENKCRKIISPCRFGYPHRRFWIQLPEYCEGVGICKGGKLFYFVPSCYLISIPHPIFHALSNSDTSTLPTHAMPSWFELHKFAPHICFLAILFPCAMANPFITRTDFPGSCTCSLPAALPIFKSHAHLPPWVLSFSSSCKYHSVLWRQSISTYFFRISLSQLLSSSANYT